MGYLPIIGGEENGRSVELIEDCDPLFIQGASRAEQINFTPRCCRHITHLYERICRCHCVVVYGNCNPSCNNWNELQLRSCGFRRLGQWNNAFQWTRCCSDDLFDSSWQWFDLLIQFEQLDDRRLLPSECVDNWIHRRLHQLGSNPKWHGSIDL